MAVNTSPRREYRVRRTVYTGREQRQLEELFGAFEEADIGYVVPRNYRGLPEYVHGGDVDVLVRSDYYAEAIARAEALGFEAQSSATDGLSELIRTGLSKPRAALAFATNHPGRLVEHVRRTMGWVDHGNGEVAQHYAERKLYDGDLMVHLMNHLAYTSPLNGVQIRVDPRVEEALYERSRLVDGLRVPSPPDELAHLVCRGVFDKEGSFPNYYVDRCEELKADVYGSDSTRTTFESLLSMLFFDASAVVYDHVDRGEYDSIRRELIRYDRY
ncbi:hypothetical protein [Natronobeatus ordinarius]|uniref:hypothetical protein n=1 Tax=Natronobeatus ordinarius TaxID=2963433 RepID=UPI0020CCE4A1|nr:hypothetical protein [Natronobeatus ordinarius]